MLLFNIAACQASKFNCYYQLATGVVANFQFNGISSCDCVASFIQIDIVKALTSSSVLVLILVFPRDKQAKEDTAFLPYLLRVVQQLVLSNFFAEPGSSLHQQLACPRAQCTPASGPLLELRTHFLQHVATNLGYWVFLIFSLLFAEGRPNRLFAAFAPKTFGRSPSLEGRILVFSFFSYEFLRERCVTRLLYPHLNFVTAYRTLHRICVRTAPKNNPIVSRVFPSKPKSNGFGLRANFRRPAKHPASDAKGSIRSSLGKKIDNQSPSQLSLSSLIQPSLLARETEQYLGS